MPGGCTPRMKGCSSRCLHFLHVLAYRQERERQEEIAEQASNGYAIEHGEYVKEHPLLTFKDYLQQTKGWNG